MGKKVMVSFLAALMIASSFSTTAFAALGKTDTVAKTQQEQQEIKKKVVKKKTASSKTTTDEKETDWKEEMLTLVNAERKKAGLSALKLDEKMCEAAQVRAEECLKSYSHTRPNGKELTTALDEAGVKYSYWGENIHEKQTSVKGAMESWMDSEGHKANILGKNFNSVGFGRVKDKNGKYYMVQMFAKVK